MIGRLNNAISRFHSNDICWTDKYLSKTIFYAGYFVRRRLDDAIESQSSKANGRCLDVGCGNKPYEQLFVPFVDSYLGIEYSPDSGYRGNRADVAADASSLPFEDASFDTVLCTEVLEHVMHPEKVISELARVTSPGGRLIVTAPFCFPIHDSFDFFRYTDKGVAVIMERYGLEIEEIRPLSGTGETLAVLINNYIFEIGFMWKKWLYPIGIVIRPLLWLLICLVNIAGWIMHKVIPSNHLSFNHLTVASKPK